MPHVLMIAYHYPPVGSSSGVHRTLKFSQYLRDHDWEPIILTINPIAYEQVNNHQLKDIPEGIYVKRAFGLDTARHLAIAGRYPGLLSLPDRWISWWFGGVVSGLRLIRKYKPKVIMSTYPIATAHLIGLTLHRLTGIPWVADFRDSMTEPHYPVDRKKWKCHRWIEQKAVKYCEKIIFTTPGTIQMYTDRYPKVAADHWAVIENGYDEEKFRDVEAELGQMEPNTSGKIKLVHSGLLYPNERDPRQFFEAINELKKNGKESGESLCIILRASGNEDNYSALLKELDIADIVELAPSVSYAEALKEMLQADALLIFQASSCNHQIPAKIYEYIRARKPVFAMTDESGDTAAVLRDAGITSIVRLDSKDSIKNGLQQFLSLLRDNKAQIANEEAVQKHSRKHKSQELAKILDVIAR